MGSSSELGGDGALRRPRRIQRRNVDASRLLRGWGSRNAGQPMFLPMAGSEAGPG